MQSIPSINAAMFALLPPGARLAAHRDPFAGSLRYHLGLVTPNSELCRIVVDGGSYCWRDGEAVMFDETFIHFAENKTDQTRLILFCDIERPLRNRFMRMVNRGFKGVVIRASETQNLPGERIGALNYLFWLLYHVRIVGKRIKEWNRKFYYLVKWLLIGGLLFFIFSPR